MARYKRKIKKHIRQRITLVVVLLIAFLTVFSIAKLKKQENKVVIKTDTNASASQGTSASQTTSSAATISSSQSASEEPVEIEENDIFKTLTESEKLRINKSFGYIYNNTYDKANITPEQAYFITCMYYQIYGYESEIKVAPKEIKDKILSEEIYQNLCYTENYDEVKYISTKTFTGMLSKMFDESVIKSTDISKYYFKDIDGYILPLNISGEYMTLYKVTKVLKNEDGTFTVRMDGFDTKQVKDMMEENTNPFLINAETTESYKDGTFFEVICIKNSSNYYVFKSFK